MYGKTDKAMNYINPDIYFFLVFLFPADPGFYRVSFHFRLKNIFLVFLRVICTGNKLFKFLFCFLTFEEHI